MLTLWILALLARFGQLVECIVRFPLLPFFGFFAAASICEDGYYIHSIRVLHDATGEQKALAPIMAILRILAALEATLWLSTALPRFERYGRRLTAGCFILAAALALTMGPKGGGLQRLEVATSAGLVMFLALHLWFHAAIGNEARSAMWHAGLFGLAMAANGAGWWFMRNPAIGAPLMFGGQIVAAILWCWLVRTPPTWREPVPDWMRK